MLNRQDYDRINKNIAKTNVIKTRRRGRLIRWGILLTAISMGFFLCGLAIPNHDAGVYIFTALALLGSCSCFFFALRVRYQAYYSRERWMQDKVRQEAQMQVIRDQQRVGLYGAVKDSRYIPDALRQTILIRDRHRCQRCGSQSYLELDHIIPLSKGGATSFENLQVLCRGCNLNKGGR